MAHHAAMCRLTRWRTRGRRALDAPLPESHLVGRINPSNEYAAPRFETDRAGRTRSLHDDPGAASPPRARCPRSARFPTCRRVVVAAALGGADGRCGRVQSRRRAARNTEASEAHAPVHRGSRGGWGCGA